MKQLIIVGSGGYFADSFLYFREHGFKVTVLSLPCAPFMAGNYRIYRDLGFEVLDYAAASSAGFDSLSIDRETLVISGCAYAGAVETLYDPAGIHKNELAAFHALAEYSRQHHCGAFFVRYSNGDTSFGSEEYTGFWRDNALCADLLVFDNDLLREFFIQNIPEVKEKPFLIGWTETPLSRFVRHNGSTGISRSFLSLGRLFIRRPAPFPAPVQMYPYFNITGAGKMKNKLKHLKNELRRLRRGMPARFTLAGRSPLRELVRYRTLFFEKHCDIAFGLSHLYNYPGDFSDRFLRNRSLFFSGDGQHLAVTVWAPKEAYYTFVNQPNKDACFLMNGIIPLIPHELHSLYHELIHRKMAILIREPEDLKGLMSLSDEEIREYRDNIYENRALYTFEATADRILAAFEAHSEAPLTGEGTTPGEGTVPGEGTTPGEDAKPETGAGAGETALS